MRIGEEIQRREKEQRIAQIYTDISYYGKLKELTEVTEYRYPPFDRGERLAKQNSHQNKTQNNVRKRIILYIQDHSIQ
jgi:hypothetical protein